MKVKCENWYDSIICTLENDNGMKVSSLNYGCIIKEILVPDRNGVFKNVVLGCETLEQYKSESAYFGAVVGRVAGRIKNSDFSLNGKYYKLPSNDGNNHLHGNGEFSHVFWDLETGKTNSGVFVKYSYVSPDGSNGYPGEVSVSVTYLLNNENELKIFYTASSSKDTILNLTNHSYFNLSGDFDTEVLSDSFYSTTEKYVDLDSALIPTGNLIKTADTKFDFSHKHSISEEFDHALVFDCKGKHLATLSNSASGRVMTMTTDYPCYVLYTGNFLSKPHTGVCLEAQFLPDAIHNENFGKIVLLKNEKYENFVSYKFDIE
ncbi:MAG: galactose mutarotase [Oscillospiraceae bacterium]|nr:galactose mutarotase [Oscillospiraceae bacterium]